MTDRPANLRDVATARPGALRAGMLLRSEAPQPGDRAPAAVAWPPRTVIDLRSPGELAGSPHPLAGPGTTVVALPMSAGLAPAALERQRDRAVPMTRVYLDVLDVAGTWLPPLVAQAAHAPAPVLVHCAAGKDRTGIAVAVLLVLAGVPRAAVEADYARTAAGLAGAHARLDAAAARRGRGPLLHSDVHPPALAAVLDRLRDERG